MRAHVLVVEDSSAAREGLTLVLRQRGFRVTAAPNGLEALAYLSGGGPADVIVLDLMMPVMDGWTFRRAQLQDPWLADIPVVALSALDDRPVSGVTPQVALHKPVDPRLLIETVSRICDRRHRATRAPGAGGRQRRGSVGRTDSRQD